MAIALRPKAPLAASTVSCSKAGALQSTRPERESRGQVRLRRGVPQRRDWTRARLRPRANQLRGLEGVQPILVPTLRPGELARNPRGRATSSGAPRDLFPK